MNEAVENSQRTSDVHVAAGVLPARELEVTNESPTLQSWSAEDTQTAEVPKKIRRLDSWNDRPYEVLDFAETQTNLLNRPSGPSTASGFEKVPCQWCLRTTGPGRFGLPSTEYTGVFYCNTCWPYFMLQNDSQRVQARTVRSGPHARVPLTFDYTVTVGPGHGRRVRLLERDADDTWTIEFKNKDIREKTLEEWLARVSEEPVECMEEFKSMLLTIFSAIPPDRPRRMEVGELHTEFSKRSRCIVPKKLGHQTMKSLLGDAKLASLFWLDIRGNQLYLNELRPGEEPLR